jgi:hypothetical protein
MSCEDSREDAVKGSTLGGGKSMSWTDKERTGSLASSLRRFEGGNSR